MIGYTCVFDCHKHCQETSAGRSRILTYLQFCYKFNRRYFGEKLLDRLI